MSRSTCCIISGSTSCTFRRSTNTTDRTPFTRKFSKWNTFCVVHPYSGTLHSILINWTSATAETTP
uniref:Uncharacterized protein n=1 Tax=Arundo donax TaxID=35708 RepID=A0A0A9FU90_ARUDO